ncbi:hypothetical protein ZWY2020_012348 [Hordeum vulgare]|nr:hypothetical protein ZWY2020_012348 [Hordeum vulgare]
MPIYISLNLKFRFIVPRESRLPMEQPLWGSVFVVLVTLLFLKAVFRGGRRRYKYNLPPGPKPCPIIGNLNLIGTLPHRSIHALSKRYGPLMYLRFGYFPVVVGSSVEMARFFLKTRDVVFVDRPKTAAGKYSNYNYGDITWSPYGAYWRQARKICLTELFSAKRLDSLEYIRFEEMRALLSGLQEASGRVVLLKDYLSTLSLNVMMRMVLGNKCLDKGVKEAGSLSVPTPEELKWMVNEFFFLSGVHNIGDSIPWLGWLDLQGYVKRMKKLSKMFDRFLEQVVDEHTERRRLQGEGFVASDFLDVLLEIASDPNLEVKISREGIKAFTQDLIVGAETSASTVEWAISEILMKPEGVAAPLVPPPIQRAAAAAAMSGCPCSASTSSSPLSLLPPPSSVPATPRCIRVAFSSSCDGGARAIAAASSSSKDETAEAGEKEGDPAFNPSGS